MFYESTNQVQNSVYDFQMGAKKQPPTPALSEIESTEKKVFYF